MADAATSGMFTVLQDLKYRENEEEDEDVVPKNRLDLFLPEGSSTSTPVVVFVHGGGWMRGDKQLFRHFSSLYDTNLLMCLFSWYYNAYRNVGETLAKNGIACALVSYRLSRLYFPWILLQIFCSFIASILVISIPLFSLAVLINIFIPFDAHISLYIVQIIGIISMLTLWIFVCKNDKTYRLSNFEKVRPIIFSVFLSVFTPISTSIFSLLIWIGVVLFCSFATLQPRTKPANYPTHICDVADSIKWIKDYGRVSQRFSCSSVFLCGHSAGGHIVSSLAIDSKYLKDVGLSLSDIKGVISISGVYDIPSLSNPVVDQLWIKPVFGDNKEQWTIASPLYHLDRQTSDNILAEESDKNHHSRVPFLVLNAAFDPVLKQDAVKFVTKLKEKNYPCKHIVIPRVNHFTILLSFGMMKGQLQYTEEICLEFIRNILQNFGSDSTDM